MMRSEQTAPCPEAPLSFPDPLWDTRPEFSAGESEALDTLVSHFRQGGKHWPPYIQKQLSRLLLPLRDTLIGMHAAKAPYNSSIHDITLEMHRIPKTYWAWTQAEWSEVICSTEGEFHRRFGASGNCRQYVIALAWLLCGFDRLVSCGVFYQYRLCLKVFGRQYTDDAVSRLNEMMLNMGYVPCCGRNNSVRNAMCMAMLLQREPQPERISVDTLRYIATVGPAYLREASATLSRILASSGIINEGFDHRVSERRRPPREYNAVDDVPAEWLAWCERWRATSVLRPSSIEACWYTLLKCGRWLADAYPTCMSPADWTRETAIAWVTTACKMKVGEWANPGGMYHDRRGMLMKPSARVGMLRHVRTLFHDLQEWGWIPVKFSPERVMRTPRSLSTQTGPDPRIVRDDLWCKLIHAGQNLQATDLPNCVGYPYFYPLEMVRALSVLWLFGGLRRDEILRMRCGCIRWQISEENDEQRICLLDVPVSKTYAAFTKPVDPLVGDCIERWEQVRSLQALQEDPKTGERVHFLFMHRGKRVHGSYINKSLIPLLCKKAGIPQQDARGRITSHRARATIASQLYNAREPLDILELQKWLGHASPESTRHYVDITPTKLAGSLGKAGYFERNRRMVSVLIDQDVIAAGQATEGKPWRYYDLGHGFCTYDFFDQCPHRMACAKCSFYLPKSSSEVQYLESRQNLIKLLQEIPLTEDEQAAVDNDIAATERLLTKLSDITPPGEKKK
ncbi:tyrosine-type recombinase/integrase [Erwinia psidii]|uniref:tyrosine-type recombinase/integrase n=1 Tax=Erwinia psidii TaxID=69224 RepID=UPI00226BB4C2|nr:tyrosine-type recombinase/integrase [Erwinia psidii]